MSRNKTIVVLVLLAVLLVFTGCQEPAATSPEPAAENAAAYDSSPVQNGNADLEIHILDVGQGDSILILCEGEAMLIDAGTNSRASSVVAYLEALGLNKLKYVVGTHPHEDHIGGLDEVILAFDVEDVLMPRIAHTTRTFEDVLDAIEAKGLQITAPEPGDVFSLGGATFTSLNPLVNEKDLNNSSIMLRLEYQGHTALFTGDAEEKAEQAVLAKAQELGLALDSDILKAGHHGSKTSSSWTFLEAVSPELAVISCGTGNSYGHPHDEMIGALASLGVQTLRTDVSGNIRIAFSESGYTLETLYAPAEPYVPAGDHYGEDLNYSEEPGYEETPWLTPTGSGEGAELESVTASTEPSAVPAEPTAIPEEPVTAPEPAATPEEIYYRTATGQVYHIGSCSYLNSSKIEITLNEAVAQGYRSCSRCLGGD